jgi:endonuclease/exonuclease/phosphatase (EEP) superfamily protein YafD
VLGGDLNLRHPELPDLSQCAGRDVDHVFARGLRVSKPPEVLERGALSDHPPIVVDLERG